MDEQPKNEQDWPTLTLDEEYRIRRCLQVGLNGWEHPPKLGDECQDKGMYPFYSTIGMAEDAMQELLRLKAEVEKYRAEEAKKYYSIFADYWIDGMQDEGRRILYGPDSVPDNEE